MSDTDTDYLEDRNREAFTEEDLDMGFDLWKLWNPNGSPSEFARERREWHEAMEDHKRDMADPVDSFQDLLRGLNERTVKEAMNK